jgi:hypothetical protein
MTDFIVTITDPEQLAGITWAREQRNASLPPAPVPPEPLPPGDEPVIDNTLPPEPLPELPPDQRPLETDEEYVQWVMGQAAASYAVQQEQATWRQAYADAQVESKRKREARDAEIAAQPDDPDSAESVEEIVDVQNH